MAKVLGVEFGTSAIRICEVDYKAKAPKVYKYVTLKTPEGAFRDDVVEPGEELVSLIKEALSENRIRTKQMVFTMNSTKIASREVAIPYVKENKIGEVIKTNASDYFPVDLDQYELAYTVIGESENEKGIKQYKVQVLAAPKNMINGYLSLAQALGCTVAALDYSGNSLYQMVHAHCDTGVKMVVKINENASMITVMKDQVIVLQRNVSYGVGEIIEGVMNSSYFGSPSYDAALHILRERDCLQNDSMVNVQETVEAPGQEGADESAQLKEEFNTTLNYLISGIARVVDYYNSRSNGAVIEKVYITGIGGDFAGMDQLLKNAIDIRVQPLKEIEGFRLERDFKGESFGQYITCIGAAIKPLGFLNETNEKKKKMDMVPDEQSVKRIAIMVLAGGILIAVVLSATALLRYKELKRENTRLQQRIVELEPIKNVYAAYLQQRYTFDKVNFFYNSTVTPNEGLVEFIEEMEEKMPYTIYVENLNSTLDNVSLTLSVRDKKDAAKVIQQFRTFATIDPNAIVISSLTDTGAVMDGEVLTEDPRVSFTITLTFKGGDPEAVQSVETPEAQTGSQEGEEQPES